MVNTLWEFNMEPKKDYFPIDVLFDFLEKASFGATPRGRHLGGRSCHGPSQETVKVLLRSRAPILPFSEASTYIFRSLQKDRNPSRKGLKKGKEPL